jgi:hypothetical protein
MHGSYQKYTAQFEDLYVITGFLVCNLTVSLAASVVYWLACWPLLPEFMGSKPAKAVRFFWKKNSSACLPLEGK